MALCESDGLVNEGQIHASSNPRILDIWILIRIWSSSMEVPSSEEDDWAWG